MDFFDKYKDDMISYVKHMLNQYDTSTGRDPRILKIGYSRFEHTMRVFKWMQKLYAAYPDSHHIDLEVLSIATIFHDIGYYDTGNIGNHAAASAVYCREYLQNREYPSDKTEFICDIISRHSDKKALHEDIPEELILLMEADLLDDTGAQGLVMDVWLEAVCEEKATYQSILEHMEKYTVKIMRNNPMRTAEGIKIWNEKKMLTEAFVQSYKEDIRI